MGITPQLGAESSGRRIVIAKQAAFGTRALAGSGQVYARSEVTLDRQKELITSNEVRQSRGIVTRRHGPKTSEASLNCDLRPGLLEPFMASMLGGTPAAATPSAASAGDGFTIVSNVLSRVAGGGQSFFTDGRYEGEVISSSLFAGNNRIASLTATAITLVDDVADVVAPDEAATITSAGKQLGTPTTWPAREFYTIEDQYLDIGVSFIQQDQLLSNVTLTHGDADIVDVSLGFIGGLWERLAANHFTNPLAELANEACGTEGTIARIHGRDIGVTALTLNMDNPEAETLRSAGQNGILTAGRGKHFDVTGSWTGHLYDDKYTQAFDVETEDDFAVFFESIGATPNPFVGFSGARCKINSDSIEDQTNVTSSFDFSLQEQVTAVDGVPSGTIRYQDSGA